MYEQIFALKYISTNSFPQIYLDRYSYTQIYALKYICTNIFHEIYLLKYFPWNACAYICAYMCPLIVSAQTLSLNYMCSNICHVLCPLKSTCTNIFPEIYLCKIFPLKYICWILAIKFTCTNIQNWIWIFKLNE